MSQQFPGVFIKLMKCSQRLIPRCKEVNKGFQQSMGDCQRVSPSGRGAEQQSVVKAAVPKAHLLSQKVDSESVWADY